jgi:hypothetical protein
MKSSKLWQKSSIFFPFKSSGQTRRRRGARKRKRNVEIVSGNYLQFFGNYFD